VLSVADQHGDTNGLGHQIVQKCQPLSVVLSREKIDPRQVSARSGEAGDQAKLDRIFADAEDDRGGRGRSFGRLCGKVAGRSGDDRHVTMR